MQGLAPECLTRVGGVGATIVGAAKVHYGGDAYQRRGGRGPVLLRPEIQQGQQGQGGTIIELTPWQAQLFQDRPGFGNPLLNRDGVGAGDGGHMLQSPFQ